MHTESPTIRPPSEWRSILVRVTRGCKWNRCRFCGIYPHLGVPHFSVRSVAEIKHDIDQLAMRRKQADTAFLGDADPLQIGLEPFAEIIRYLRSVIPLQRVTCYARASTLWQIKAAGIQYLADSGLNRVHIGLESGDDETLRYHRKGQSTKMLLQTAEWLKQAGIEISYYVLLGLGGKTNWRNHITKTAQLINRVNPDFVRIRRLWLYGNGPPGTGPGCPLLQEIRNGDFTPQTPEGTILELKLLLEELQSISSFVACDHANNYIRVAGQLMDDKQEMLAEINDFLALPGKTRQAHYEAVGSQI